MLVLKPHNAALFCSAIVSLLVGFILNKYLVFVESNLSGRVQLFRYTLSFFVNVVVNYFLLRLFVEKWHLEEFFAQLIAATTVILFSYLTQKHFTFKNTR